MEQTKLSILQELLTRDLKFQSDFEGMAFMLRPDVAAKARAEMAVVIDARRTEIKIEETPDGGLSIEYLKNFLAHLKEMDRNEMFYKSDGDQQIKDLEQRIENAEADAAEETRGDNDRYSPIEEIENVDELLLKTSRDIGIRLSHTGPGGTLVDIPTHSDTIVGVNPKENFHLEFVFDHTRGKTFQDNRYCGTLLSGDNTSDSLRVTVSKWGNLQIYVKHHRYYNSGNWGQGVYRNMPDGINTLVLHRDNRIMWIGLNGRIISRRYLTVGFRFTTIGENPNGGATFPEKIYSFKMKDKLGDRIDIDFGAGYTEETELATINDNNPIPDVIAGVVG